MSEIWLRKVKKKQPKNTTHPNTKTSFLKGLNNAILLPSVLDYNFYNIFRDSLSQDNSMMVTMTSTSVQSWMRTEWVPDASFYPASEDSHNSGWVTYSYQSVPTVASSLQGQTAKLTHKELLMKSTKHLCFLHMWTEVCIIWKCSSFPLLTEVDSCTSHANTPPAGGRRAGRQDDRRWRHRGLPRVWLLPPALVWYCICPSHR